MLSNTFLFYFAILFRLNKHAQRQNLMPHRNLLECDQDHIVQNPSIYQISVSNQANINPMEDRVNISNESGNTQ